MMRTLDDIYRDYPEYPYIAPQFAEELRRKPLAKRQMERTPDGFLPGHIIMLWRIQFGTYFTTSPHHKYFYTTYGIDAEKEVRWLVAEGFVRIASAFESVKHLSAMDLKDFLTQKGVKGLSKMKRIDLDVKLLECYTEEELATLFDLRQYVLTEAGETLLAKHPEIIAKHPQKKY